MYIREMQKALSFSKAWDCLNRKNKLWPLNRWKFLGSGCYGKAYKVSNNLCVKLADTDLTLKTIKRVKNHQSKNLSKVHDVFYYTKKDAIVLMSLYKKLSSGERYQLNKLLDVIEGKLSSGVCDKQKLLKCYIDPYLDPHPILKKESRLIDKYNIINIAKDLKKHKIKYKDWHAGNFAKDENGNYILIDLI